MATGGRGVRGEQTLPPRGHPACSAAAAPQPPRRLLPSPGGSAALPKAALPATGLSRAALPPWAAGRAPAPPAGFGDSGEVTSPVSRSGRGTAEGGREGGGSRANSARIPDRITLFIFS